MESAHSSPFSTYSAPGVLRQDPGRAAESSTSTGTSGNGGHEVRVLLSMYGSRGDVARVADLGIGAAHDGPTATTESLSAALGTALTPESPERAAAAAGAIRPNAATVAATLRLDA